MPTHRRIVVFLLAVLGMGWLQTGAGLEAPADPEHPTLAQVLAESTPTDWRQPDPEDVLYLDLPAGRVVIELAAGFAPAHVANIRTLARAGYWDGLAILRVQDNYVVQWGDPRGEDAEKRKPLGKAASRLPAEFERRAEGVAFAQVDSRDAYAPEVGFVDGFPTARDPVRGTLWLAHCYGLVGAGRDNAADSSNGAELYVVIGHAPRHLDRNITSVGRVLKGMELLSALPRGPEPMGFHASPAQYIPISALRLASELPESERVPLEVLRTDTPTFQRLVQARRERHEEWFVEPVGRIELCNIPIPVRAASSRLPVPQSRERR
jgi:peptidylprolyl isomerase